MSPGWGAKIPHAVKCGQEIKINKEKVKFKEKEDRMNREQGTFSTVKLFVCYHDTGYISLYIYQNLHIAQYRNEP